VRFFRLLGFDVLFSSPNLVLFNAGIGGIFDNFTVGTVIDWVMTAGVIGWGGTELAHSVIEGMVKGRGLWKEMREVESGRQSILDAEFFSEYVAPELEERGVSIAALRQTMQTLRNFGVSVDDLISSLTIGKVDQLIAKLEADPEKVAAAYALRDFLDGVPPQQQVEIPNVLNLLTPDQRRRFLGV
jgi:succinate dehydrogenase/fumarate reductase flavoprotein subunit